MPIRMAIQETTMDPREDEIPTLVATTTTEETMRITFNTMILVHYQAMHDIPGIPGTFATAMPIAETTTLQLRPKQGHQTKTPPKTATSMKETVNLLTQTTLTQLQLVI
jgi:hypothetical protein